MPRREINFIANNYYHVFTKTIDHHMVFDTNNANHFLKTIQYYLQIQRQRSLSWTIRNGGEIYRHQTKQYGKIAGYCIMPNHFHLLIKQNKYITISEYISLILNSFTRYYNTHKVRKGPLFITPFKAVEIHTYQQFIHVSRYIHLNPFSSGLVNSYEELIQYPYSSLKTYESSDSNISFIYKRDIFSSFTQKSYIQFVLGNADYQRRLERHKKQRKSF